MTSATPAEQLTDRDDVLAAHFAAVERMHREALEYLDALAESIMQSETPAEPADDTEPADDAEPADDTEPAERPEPADLTGPDTQQIFLPAGMPPVRSDAAA